VTNALLFVLGNFVTLQRQVVDRIDAKHCVHLRRARKALKMLGNLWKS